MERPSKRRRTYQDPDVDAGTDDIERDRRRNDLRLKSAFESIFLKYARDFTEVGDEIDLRTGQIVVDNGHLSHMRDENDLGTADDEEDAVAFLRCFTEQLQEDETEMTDEEAATDNDFSGEEEEDIETDANDHESRGEAQSGLTDAISRDPVTSRGTNSHRPTGENDGTNVRSTETNNRDGEQPDDIPLDPALDRVNGETSDGPVDWRDAPPIEEHSNQTTQQQSLQGKPLDGSSLHHFAKSLASQISDFISQLPADARQKKQKSILRAALQIQQAQVASSPLKAKKKSSVWTFTRPQKPRRKPESDDSEEIEYDAADDSMDDYEPPDHCESWEDVANSYDPVGLIGLNFVARPRYPQNVKRPRKLQPFTTKDEELILHLRDERNFGWQDIGVFFTDKTLGQVQYHYYNKLRRGNWKEKRDRAGEENGQAELLTAGRRGDHKTSQLCVFQKELSHSMFDTIWTPHRKTNSPYRSIYIKPLSPSLDERCYVTLRASRSSAKEREPGNDLPPSFALIPEYPVEDPFVVQPSPIIMNPPFYGHMENHDQPYKEVQGYWVAHQFRPMKGHPNGGSWVAVSSFPGTLTVPSETSTTDVEVEGSENREQERTSALPQLDDLTAVLPETDPEILTKQPRKPWERKILPNVEPLVHSIPGPDPRFIRISASHDPFTPDLWLDESSRCKYYHQEYPRAAFLEGQSTTPAHLLPPNPPVMWPCSRSGAARSRSGTPAIPQSPYSRPGTASSFRTISTADSLSRPVSRASSRIGDDSRPNAAASQRQRQRIMSRVASALQNLPPRGEFSVPRETPPITAQVPSISRQPRPGSSFSVPPPPPGYHAFSTQRMQLQTGNDHVEPTVSGLPPTFGQQSMRDQIASILSFSHHSRPTVELPTKQRFQSPPRGSPKSDLVVIETGRRVSPESMSRSASASRPSNTTDTTAPTPSTPNTPEQAVTVTTSCNKSAANPSQYPSLSPAMAHTYPKPHPNEASTTRQYWNQFNREYTITLQPNGGAMITEGASATKAPQLLSANHNDRAQTRSPSPRPALRHIHSQSRGNTVKSKGASNDKAVDFEGNDVISDLTCDETGVEDPRGDLNQDDRVGRLDSNRPKLPNPRKVRSESLEVEPDLPAPKGLRAPPIRRSRPKSMVKLLNFSGSEDELA